MNTMDSDVANYDTVTLTLVNKWRIVNKYISTKIKAIKSYIILNQNITFNIAIFFLFGTPPDNKHQDMYILEVHRKFKLS